MAPFGGEPARGFDASPERLEALERYFQAGEADLEVVQSYASGDIAVLVVIERQHDKVGGLPDQEWSLRVTLVFRREGSAWRLVHRHADPLVHGISLEQAAAIARGEFTLAGG
jgi:ketosteroid isomerase-like protein